MFKRIIVGVDGSHASMRASELAFKIGCHFDLPVVGVYVVDSRLIDESFIADLAGVLGFTYYEGISAKVKEFLEKQGDTVLTEFSSLGRQCGAKVSVVQLTGLPYREITSQADPEDFIVVGRFGKKPIKGLFIGSNSEKIARHAKCPVMVVPPKERKIKKVLVAYDRSDNSKKALEVSLFLRDVFKYEIEVIFVEAEEETQPGQLSKEIKLLTGEFLPVNVLTGFPEERIVKLAQEENFDMVFLGAFGKDRFRELFLGSVTTYVLNHLDVPLVLCKSLTTSGRT